MELIGKILVQSVTNNVHNLNYQLFKIAKHKINFYNFMIYQKTPLQKTYINKLMQILKQSMTKSA
jgi:hypothetical protein